MLRKATYLLLFFLSMLAIIASTTIGIGLIDTDDNNNNNKVFAQEQQQII